MLDRNELLLRIRTLLRRDRVKALNHLLSGLLPADIVDVIENLDDNERQKLFKFIPFDIAADVLDELETDDFEKYIAWLAPLKIKRILGEMSADDIVDIIAELSLDKQQRLISLMEPEDAVEINELLQYQEDTAGGIMTKDFIAIAKDLTVQQAIEQLREDAPEAETVYYVYVVDSEQRLVGVVSLREMIVSAGSEIIENIMREKVIHVGLTTDQEEVARKVSKYDLLAIPVVDENDRLVGIVTVDDVLDVIEEEATEDIYRISGTVEEPDTYEEGRTFKRLFSAVKARLPWLIVTLFGGLISSSIIRNYEHLLEAEVILAAFMPLLAGMGGNVGTQSASLTIRAIAIGKMENNTILKNILKEAAVGMSMGVICGILVTGMTMLLGSTGQVGLLVGASMCVNMLTAAAIGTLMPLVFRKIGVDPAVASAPFITTTIDATGYTIYFTLIGIFLARI